MKFKIEKGLHSFTNKVGHRLYTDNDFGLQREFLGEFPTYEEAYNHAIMYESIHQVQSFEIKSGVQTIPQILRKD